MAGAAATADEYRSQVDESKQKEFDRVNKLFEENFKNDDPSQSVDEVWQEFRKTVKEAGKVGLSEQEMDTLFEKMKPRYEQAAKYEKEAPHTKNTAERHYKEDTVKNFKASTKAASSSILDNIKWAGKKINEKLRSVATDSKGDVEGAFKKAKPWLLVAMALLGDRVFATIAIVLLIQDIHQKLTEKRLQEELQAQQEETEEKASQAKEADKTEETKEQSGEEERTPGEDEPSEDIPADEQAYPFGEENGAKDAAAMTAALTAAQQENERLRKELEETKQKLAASQKREKELEAQIGEEMKEVNKERPEPQLTEERIDVRGALKDEKDKAAAAEFAQRTDLYEKGMKVFEENNTPNKLLVIPTRNQSAPVIGIPKGSKSLPDYKGELLNSLKEAKSAGKTELSKTITDVRYAPLTAGTSIDKAIEEVEKRAEDQRNNEARKVPNAEYNGSYFIGGTEVGREEAAKYLAQNGSVKDFDKSLNYATREGIILKDIREVGAKLKENESLIGNYTNKDGEKRRIMMTSLETKFPDYRAIHKQLQQLQKQGVKTLDHDIVDPRFETTTLKKGMPIKTAIEITGNRAETDRRNALKEKTDPDIRDDGSKMYDQDGNRIGDQAVSKMLSENPAGDSDKDSFVRKLSNWKENHKMELSAAKKGYLAAKTVISKYQQSAERAAAQGASRI